MNLNYKIATKDDIPLLISLEKSVSGSKTYSPTLETSKWEKELDEAKVYLIEKDDEIVGNAGYEDCGDGLFYINRLVINPKFQGKGIGRLAFEKLMDEMKDAKRIEVDTHPDNIPTNKLYIGAGFVIESRHENYYGDGEPRLRLALSRI
jgi:ribosomal protein S18 acetylase RimI-like enzyme